MKVFRITVWILLFWVAVAFIALNLPKKSTVDSALSPIAGFNQGSHFTLTDHNGTPFNSNNAIKDGAYGLLFFGFTHCPAICPTELQKIATVMDSLSPENAAKLTPIFVTIDPERDTAEAMSNYVPQFHEKIIGLTGKTDAVHKVLDDWKIFYTKVNDPALSDYTMDHSTYSYLVDHQMNIIGLYRLKNTANEITDHIESVL